VIGSLEVGASFKIIDQASGPLKEIAAQLKAIDDAINTVKGSLVELAESKFPGLTRRIGTLTERMEALGVSAQKGADGIDKTPGIGSPIALKGPKKRSRWGTTGFLSSSMPCRTRCGPVPSSPSRPS
jgi:hypothetical protein